MTKMSAERKQHLECVSETYNVPLGTVQLLAEVLGEDEDYDGLVTACQDYEEEDYSDIDFDEEEDLDVDELSD
jgi:hypothetical protein